MKTAEEFFGTAPQPIQWADRSGRTAPATQAPLPIKLPEGSMLPPDPEVRQVLTETAERYKINPALLMAMAQQESGYNPDATGPETQWGTAKGMFQFLDSTAQGKGIDPLDWKQAAEAAAEDLARGIATRGTDWAIAHHFAGPDPKQHGPKTARYTQEVLAKANAIARELGIEFHIPDSAKADFSRVTGGVNDAHLPSADDFFSGNAQPASAAQPTSDGPEDFRTTANRVIAEAAPNTVPGMNPLPEMAIRAVGRTVARGWEGIKNALNRDTETVEYSDEELRREWDTNRTVRNTALEQGMGFAQWAERNRTRTVSTKPFAQEEAEWAERLKENPEDAYLLPKRLSHLRPQADDSNFAPAGTFQGIAQRFISNAKNPIDLFLQDSIPADIVTAMFSMPELERKKFDQARQISQAFDIVNSDETKSSEEMEMAEEVLSDWRRRTDQSITEAWSEMWQAAKEDPSGIGVALYEAIAADPYMAAAPMGTGVIKPMRAINAARVARSGVPRSSIARRAETVIDRFADAGTLAASLNVAAGAADNLSMEGRINDPEVKLNAAMGYALGGPLGVVFMRGARARAKGLDRAKLDGTLEETLRDSAKADVEMEAQVTDLYRRYPDGYGVGDLQTPAQTRIAEMLGIQRHKDAAAWKKQRRKEIKDAFGDNPEYADYQRYVAEERIARAQQLSEEAEAKRRSAAEAAYGRSVEDPAARAARYQAEYDAALEARNAAAEGDLMARAQADDAAWEAAQKLNAEELFYAELSRDHPTIRQTEAKIRRRNNHLGRTSSSLQRDPLKNTKALNDRGRPLRLYHGTKEKFDKFDIGRAGSSKDAGWLGRGIYFTDQPITAKFYSQAAGAESPAVIDAYADIRNPFMWGKKTRGVDNLPDEIKSDVIALVGRSPAEGALADGITQVLRGKGYDGVIAETTGTSLDTPAKEVVVFSPQQVVRRVKNKYVRAKIRRRNDHLGRPKSQRGEADPRVLAALGIGVGTAAAAALLAEDKSLIAAGVIPPVLIFAKRPPGRKVLVGYRAQKAGSHEGMGYGNTEGDGIYLAHDRSLPDSMNRDGASTQEIYYDPPRNPLEVEDTPLLGDEEWLWDPVMDSDSYWIRVNKEAMQTANAIYEGRQPAGDFVRASGDLSNLEVAGGAFVDLKELAGEILTRYLMDDGYDAVVVYPNDPEGWTVLLRDKRKNPDRTVVAGQSSERGEISPELLTRMGLVAGGAGAAFLAFPEDQKLQGTFLGGLAGLLVPGVGGSVLSRMKQAGAISPEGDIISALVRRKKMANKLEETEITARDNAWIDAARQGDQEAFRYLYETYVGKVTRYAKRFEEGSGIRAGVEAEDLAQEAFAAVFKRLAEDPELTFDPNFISYMQRAVRNQAISTVRAQGRLKRKADVVQESQYFREDLHEGNTGSDRSVLDETTGVDDYSGETIIDNVDQTPESVAIRNDLLDIIRQELDNQSEQARRLFTMTELEHYTLAEAAEQLGMSREAAYKAVQRSKQGIKNAIEQNRLKFGEPVTEETIRGPRSQRGSADPEALRGMAAVAATATAAGTAGYFFTDGDLWKTGVFTTLATPAALMLGGKFRGGTGNVIKGELKGTNRMAAAIRSIDYRLKDMGEAVYGLAKKHGHDELKRIKAYNDATAGFINTFSRLPKDIKPIVIKALSTRDKKVIDKILTETGGAKFVREFDQVRKVLDDIEDQLVGYGLIKKSEKDYFPFRVKDLDGLKKALGQDATAEIDAALVKAERKMQKSQQRPLTEIEKSLVINKVLEPYLGKPISAHTPGFAKARTIQVIEENLQPFYHDPVATLNSYGVQAIKYIERAKFFGRHLKKTKNSEGNYAVNIGDSIGELVQDLRTRGQINESQAVELASMLQDRFNGGEMASNHLVQGTKNLTNAALLGHIASAIVQLGDIAIQASRQGVIPSVKALRRQLMRDKLVDLKNYGMTEHIAHEFLSDGWTRKVADWSFKWGGFRAIDHIGKDFGLNAAIERMFSEAKTPQGIMRLSDRFQRVFPDDFDKALTALKKGQVNESVELMAFSELTRTQPITSWELPQMYHRMPNGRMIYHLQTFSLRVLNMVHEDALKDMMSLNPKRIAKGTKNLLTIGTILGVQGVAADKLKDFVAGKPVELEWEEVPLNALAALGMNMYDYNRMADKGPIAGVAEGKLPPIIRMSQQVWEDPERSVRFIPVAGRVAHDRGRDYFEQRRRERRKRQGYKMEITVPPSEGSSNRRDSRRDSRRSNRRDDRRR